MIVSEIIQPWNKIGGKVSRKYRYSSKNFNTASHPGTHNRLKLSKLAKQPIIKSKKGWTNQKHNFKSLFKRKKLR